MLKLGVGFLSGAAFINLFSSGNPRPGYWACAASSALIALLVTTLSETLSPVRRRRPPSLPST